MRYLIAVPDVLVKATSCAETIRCVPVVPCASNVVDVQVAPSSALNSAEMSEFNVAVPAPLVYVITMSPLVGVLSAVVELETKVMSLYSGPKESECCYVFSGIKSRETPLKSTSVFV